MLKVLITIDTEVYPLRKAWQDDNLDGDVRRDIYGETSSGEYGLTYQLELFRKHQIKAVFFVESLFASVVKNVYLSELVRLITQAGHEIQLHLHPEWLTWMIAPPVQPNGRWATNQFGKNEQAELLALGIRNLKAAGVPEIVAFRAGDYAANSDTLTVLRESGIRFDTSYNACYPCSFPDVECFRNITQPKLVEGVCEVPISYWLTRPFGRRHAQFACASIGELKAALWHAERNGWHSFVIVSHSFELLKRRRQRIDHPAPDRFVVGRLVELCHFLQEHSGRFQTCGFNDLEFAVPESASPKTPYVSPVYRTACRLVQQLCRRII